MQNYLDTRYPNANAVAKKFLLGPGAGGRIQARFSGPDPAVLRDLADQAKRIIVADGGAVGIRDDWREPEKVIRARPARGAGPPQRPHPRRGGAGPGDRLRRSRRRLLSASRAAAAAGVFPQETRLLPIVARPPETERRTVDAIYSMQIWSPVAGRMIPLNQVISGVETGWENPVVMRRDRIPTITVHADPRSGLPSALFNRVRSGIEGIQLPPGYTFEWGGEHEDSAQCASRVGRVDSGRAAGHGVHRHLPVQLVPHDAWSSS